MTSKSFTKRRVRNGDLSFKSEAFMQPTTGSVRVCSLLSFQKACHREANYIYNV